MAFIDLAIIAVYFVVVLGLGFWYQKRAAQNLNSYFLGDRRIPWYMLAMSGSVSNFDITGTMWIVSMLFVLGMKSMWIHWMWGFLMGAFFMAYMGKWVRRSNVMTAAEWMVTRFGSGHGGQAARTMYAIMAILTQASFIGYAFQGIGKFAAIYIPLPASTLALLIIGITTLYVLLGGLYSVVLTDVIQTIILSFAGLVIAWLAYRMVTPQQIQQLLQDDWFKLTPVWKLTAINNADYQMYQFFGVLVVVWVLKGLLLNAGGPAQMYDFQRFLAARDARDASKVGAAWSFFLIIRWAMAMGIVLLAISGALQVHDPEKVMPVVLHQYLPIGLRGLVIAGLLSAFMSTFSSTVNSGASYLVRDVWQVYFKKQNSRWSDIQISYLATVLLVLLGILIGLQASSIAQIWNWMMMALGAGVIVPNVLRWYWWRLNGWGYAAGTLAGIVLSFVILFWPEAPMYFTFPIITLGSLLTAVLISYLTPAVETETLRSFFKNVKPFGFWKPVRLQLAEPVAYAKHDRPGLALLNTVLGMMLIASLYLFPMYLVAHQFHFVKGLLLACVVLMSILYITWYKNLPQEGEN